MMQIQAEAKRRKRKARYLERKRQRLAGIFTETMREEDLQAVIRTWDRGDRLDELFSKIDNDIVGAQMLYYLNSGYMRFDQHKEYSKRWQGEAVDERRMCEVMSNEVPSAEELQKLYVSFRETHDFVNSTLRACGTCGTRDFVSDKFRCYMVKLRNLNLFAFSTQDMAKWEAMRQAGDIVVPVDARMTMRRVKPWKVMSCYESTRLRCWFHVHPELVETRDEEEYTRLCCCCRDSWLEGKVPKNSIANGIDFGWARRLGLTEPNLWEQMVLSQLRLFTMSVKVMTGGQANFTGQRHRGNAVCFVHDAPEIVLEQLTDWKYVRSLVSVYFLDAKGKGDELSKKFFGTANFRARRYVLQQWLLVLSCVNKHYQLYNDAFINKILDATDRAMQAMESEINVIENPNILRFEEKLGSDVAQVQQCDERLQLERNVDDNPGFVPLRTTFVVPTGEAILQNDNIRNRVLLTKIVDELYNDRDRDDFNNNRDSHDLDEGYRTLYSSRSDDPSNEFESHDNILGRAFPTVFMLGKAYGRPCGTLNCSQRNHFLKQFTCSTSKNVRLIGFLQDAKRRFSVIHGVNVGVKGSPKAVNNIVELINDPDIKQKFEIAIKNPTGKVARALLKKLMPSLKVGGKRVSYGVTEGSIALSNIIESAKRYGPASCFLTLAFDDRNNPRALRARYVTSSNSEFPNAFEPGCTFGINGNEYMRCLRSIFRKRSAPPTNCVAYRSSRNGQIDGDAGNRQARKRPRSEDDHHSVQQLKRSWNG